MKKIAFILLTFASITVYGQKNILHDAAFWREKPDLEKIKAEINKGNSATEAGPFGADATVYAINAQSSLAIIQFMLAQKGNDVNKIVTDTKIAQSKNGELLDWMKRNGNVQKYNLDEVEINRLHSEAVAKIIGLAKKIQVS